ncbi:AI-2E family transporter [Sphingobium estronivorans]|uniref:AI-2E family transporter n=1 Tax=Sphingobium estronivorans TaxID=1577690 RepID=UPI00123910BC|nr:AI-2E family transporter [Sphingobium estronivorans]
MNEVMRIRKMSLLLTAGALLLLGLWLSASVLPALIWAGVVAIAVLPLYERFEKRSEENQARIVLPLLFTAGVALIILVPLSLVVAEAANEARDVAQWFGAAQRTGVAAPSWVLHLPVGREFVSDWWRTHLATPELAQQEFRRLDAATVIAHSKMLGASIMHRTVIFAFTMIALFFLLREHRSVAGQIGTAIDRSLGPRGERLAEQIVRSVRGTIDGLVLVGLGEGAVMAVAYAIAGVPHAVLLGVLTAIAAMIPFGAIIAIGIAALLLVANGALLAAAVIVATGLLVIAIADHFVRPALIGGATKVPFLWVLIGILGGVERFGLLGLFIGPATMAALILLWREFTSADATGA